MFLKIVKHLRKKSNFANGLRKSSHLTCNWLLTFQLCNKFYFILHLVLNGCTCKMIFLPIRQMLLFCKMFLVSER